MTKIKVSAPGKLILLGEHTVVYGKPAIIAATNKRCLVEITPRKDGKIFIKSKSYKKEITLGFQDVIIKFNKAQIDWEIYNQNNDINLLKEITADPLDYAIIVIGQFINYFNLTTINGFELIIDSNISVGSGTGSSASLSVSIIGALSLFTGKIFDKKEINKIAFLSEQKKHGHPSGGDNATSCFGGFIWYEKGKPIKNLDLVLSNKLRNNFSIISTGTPKESTGEMVSYVKSQITNSKSQKEKIEKILADQSSLVKELLPALENGNDKEIIRIIKAGEKNLETLGVVSPYVQKIIRNIEASGGAAKICGGGGKTKGTGVVLIYHPSEVKVSQILLQFGLNSSKISLGEEGLRRE